MLTLIFFFFKFSISEKNNIKADKEDERASPKNPKLKTIDNR
tara:strand:+ start:1606 stop:1731 length:126 start_codon:yes stop_codon:yes gene_type:complete